MATKNMSKRKVKLDKITRRAGIVGAKAIRVYLPELMKEVNSSIEKGEYPYLWIIKKFNKKRGIEIEISLWGQRHIENLSYFLTHPSEWNPYRYGYIIFSPDSALELSSHLKALSEGNKERYGKELRIPPRDIKVEITCWIII